MKEPIVLESPTWKDAEVPPPPGLPPNFASLLLLGRDENWEVGINSLI